MNGWVSLLTTPVANIFGAIFYDLFAEFDFGVVSRKLLHISMYLDTYIHTYMVGIWFFRS